LKYLKLLINHIWLLVGHGIFDLAEIINFLQGKCKSFYIWFLLLYLSSYDIHSLRKTINLLFKSLSVNLMRGKIFWLFFKINHYLISFKMLLFFTLSEYIYICTKRIIILIVSLNPLRNNSKNFMGKPSVVNRNNILV
jgi:hypothetical protein